MSQRIAKKKTLFTVPESRTERPSLLGGRCSCGYLFFPPHRFGCEVCGAGPEAINIIEMAATGLLKTFAASHQQIRSDGHSPLIFGLVFLDNGLTILGAIDTDDEKKLHIGQRVHGVLAPCGLDDQGQTIVDCLFVPEGGA